MSKSSRGMSLEEFREELASDATIENEKLKEEIRKLKKELKAAREDRRESAERKNQEIDGLREDLKFLINRCYALTRGGMCVFCGIHRCEHCLKPGEAQRAANECNNGRLPMDDEGKEKLMLYIMEKRVEGGEDWWRKDTRDQKGTDRHN